MLARRLLLPELRGWVDRLDPGLGRICGYQLGLCDEHGRPTGSLDGKLVRPAFALLCAAAAGAPPADGVIAAAAVELIHNASLIHDDIMDGDRERRHRPTVWARFGVPQAILAGDALIALAFEALSGGLDRAAGCPVSDLARAVRRLAIGQGADLRFERIDTVTFSECLAMMEGKTGVLLGCACRIGALFANAPDYVADRFGQFGTHLGVAFQIVDDILGIWGDPELTGKPVGSDLRARKKSMPVVAAMSVGGASSSHLSRLYSATHDLDEAEVKLAIELIETAGGRWLACEEADRRLAMAWNCLEEIDIACAPQADLEDLVTFLAARAW